MEAFALSSGILNFMGFIQHDGLLGAREEKGDDERKEAFHCPAARFSNN
jgi:hypothetical protein